MKHSRLGAEQFKINVVLGTVVFVAVMAGLGAAWLTKGGKDMPPPKADSLAAPASTNAPPQSQ